MPDSRDLPPVAAATTSTKTPSGEMTLPYGATVVWQLWQLSCVERHWLASIACGDLASIGEPCLPSKEDIAKQRSFTQSLGIWLLNDVHEHPLNVQLLQQILADAREWARDLGGRNGIVSSLHMLLVAVEMHGT